MATASPVVPQGVRCGSTASVFGPKGAKGRSHARTEGYTLEELRRLQQYRLQRREQFLTDVSSSEKMRVLSTQPKELLSRPRIPYQIQAYTLDKDYQLTRENNADPTLRADVAPCVHDLPPRARHVRVSVPASVCRPLAHDEAATSNFAMRQRSKQKADESLSIYAHLRPGRAMPQHLTRVDKSDSMDIRRFANTDTASHYKCDKEQFLYQRRSMLPAHLAGAAIPDFRAEYDAEAKDAATRHPRAADFRAQTCEELERLSHLRAGLQILHCKLWRRQHNPPLPPPSHHRSSEDRRHGDASDTSTTTSAAESGDWFGWLANSPFPNL